MTIMNSSIKRRDLYKKYKAFIRPLSPTSVAPPVGLILHLTMKCDQFSDTKVRIINLTTK